jgi:hypothetical protein
LRAVCEGTQLWDGRVCVLQVTDAVNGNIRLRALVSANDAPSLWDLRCLVRERLVAFIWEHQQDAMPRVRAELAPETATPAAQPALPALTAPEEHHDEASADAKVFSGGRDADERGSSFGGPGETVDPENTGAVDRTVEFAAGADRPPR